MNHATSKQSIRLWSLLFACWLSALALESQGQQVTTFILVRHAEKERDDSKDPVLSAEGNARAKRLQVLLDKTTIHAVYTTPYKRTRATIEPMAQAKGLAILEYEPQREAAIDAMLKEYVGKTVLVSGHSNTIPEIANWLTASKQFKDFDDSDYGNLLIVSVVTKGNAQVTWLRY